MSQIRNTMSTDLHFEDDVHNRKLYINSALSTPSMITIKYVPKLKEPDDIKSDYWIDVLIKMSTAQSKIALGRIRTRFSQSNALWSNDGERMLEEGTSELKELMEILRNNSNLVYPID